MGGAHLDKDTGEGTGGVALKSELAVLAVCALRTRPLEQHASHAVPVGSPDGVSLQCDVGGSLGWGDGEKGVGGSKRSRAGTILEVTHCKLGLVSRTD